MLVAEDMVLRRVFFSLLLLACGASFAPACGSDARATDTCRTIENARCQRAPACNLEDFAGDVASCIRFYDVQCGRGVPDDVKEPSKSELNACLGAINSNCAAVTDPSTVVECAFLLANAGQTDAAPAETAAEAATDAADAATDASDAGD